MILNDRYGYILPCDIQRVELTMSNKSTGQQCDPGIHNTSPVIVNQPGVILYRASLIRRSKNLNTDDRVTTRRDCIQLEKVLLDPIFMILKCEYYSLTLDRFVKLHDVSTSHLEALVT